MAATSSFNQITEGANGADQAIRTRIQCKRDLNCAVGPFWHLRCRRQGPFTKITLKETHTTPRPCYHSEQTGTDRVQRPARHTPTGLPLGRFHSVAQRYRPSPSAPSEGGDHHRGGTARMRGLPTGRATLPNNAELPTSDHGAKPPRRDSCYRRLSLSRSKSRSHDDHAEMGDDGTSPHQAHRFCAKSFQAKHPMLEMWQMGTPPLGLPTS